MQPCAMQQQPCRPTVNLPKRESSLELFSRKIARGSCSLASYSS
jgi:hypothetical protein